MKYMFISDIHGNTEMLQKCLEIFEKEKADKLIILGDTSGGYYNDDQNYYIAEVLNELGNRVEIIRGNCDSSDFEEKIENEIFDDDILFIKDKMITFTHGHRYNTSYLPPNCGDIFIQGHTHVPMLLESGGRILANPGSVGRPRGSDFRGYIIIDEESIRLKSISGETVKEIKL